MTCSKIFSGDLPELTNKIMQYFWDDTSTLHSCILVNRLWCRLAIPLLWEDPFSIPTKNYRFIGIYLQNLNEDDKTKLNEYGLVFSSNTLFNYPSFIKYLNTREIIKYINLWMSDTSNTSASTLTSSIPTTSTTTSTTIVSPTTSYPMTDSSTFKSFIHKVLLKTFVEQEACLHVLIISDSLESSVNYDYFNDYFELISQNPNFIHNIKSLKLDIRNDNAILNKLITLLASNCNLISTLISHSHFDENYSLQIIKSQQNLKKITFFGYDFFFYPSLLLSLKNYNCSNTLKTIIFSMVDFQNIDILIEVFEQLNVLESVHLIDCFSLDFHFVQQITNITRPFKLKSLLTTGDEFQFEPFQLLLQKFGHYIENIGLYLQPSTQSEQQLFELITKYCTDIKFFDLSASIDLNIYLGFKLIKNIGENLNYLLIDGYSKKVSSIVLQELGQILPSKLEYLSLTLNTNDTSDFEEFLKNSQNTFINKLLIRMAIKGEDILPYVEKYIMKEKRVKHLAIKVVEWDLFHSKDVVRKFKLFNIIVQDYSDLCIDYLNYKKSNIFLDVFQ